MDKPQQSANYRSTKVALVHVLNIRPAACFFLCLSTLTVCSQCFVWCFTDPHPDCNQPVDDPKKILKGPSVLAEN